MTSLTPSEREEFDKKFPCIQPNCDDNGTLTERDENGDPTPEQCQYCCENRLPLLSFIDTLLHKREQAWREREKWMDAHARFVSDVLDGMKPEEAYKLLNKALLSENITDK